MRVAMGLFACALMGHAELAGASTTPSEWEQVAVEHGETAFTAVAVAPDAPARIFAATPHALYESIDAGQSWQARFHLPAGTRALGLAIDPSAQPILLLATDHGLYGSFDDGQDWSRIFRGRDEREAACTYVAFHPLKQGEILLGTQGGLFSSSDHGLHWNEVGVPFSARDVKHFAFDPSDPDALYLVTDQGLFVGHLAEGRWQQRVTLVGVHDEGSGVSDADVEDPGVVEPEDLRQHLTSVAVDPRGPSTVYLAGSRGLQVSADGGITWKPLPGAGLTSAPISRLLAYAHSPLVLYAATARGVIRYEPTRDQWSLLTQGLATTQVSDLAATHGLIWAATDEGLYRYQIPPDELSESEPPTARELLANFVNEPTIAQVRETAIRYAEVHPDKITRWRRQAALQALLPSVNFGLDHGTSRDLHVDEGSFPNFQLIHTTDRDAGLKFSINWDLGELIWSDDQTAIDVRSKLMVQLRDDIVDEVTRTYFERRRVQVLLLTNPPTDQHALLEKELRIQELTALIDGLTGGYFSHSMKPELN